MNIEPLTAPTAGSSETLLGVRSWHDAGVIHGFLDARFDLKRDEESALEYLSRRYSTTLTRQGLRQTHSTRIVTAPEAGCPEGDAALGDYSDPALHGTILGVLTADCAPVLVRCASSQLRAAVHCGWRGACAGLLEETLAALVSRGASLDTLELALGPAAGSCCYEVGEEVLDVLNPAERQETTSFRAGKTFFNVRGLLTRRAAQFGVSPARLATSASCTICDQRFFSFRRQKADSGRQLSFIGSSFV